MTYQFYWKNPFKLLYDKSFMPEYKIYDNILCLGPLQIKWYSEK